MIKKMNNLTELYKKGKLQGYYGQPFYIKKQNGDIKVDYLCNGSFVNNYDVVEVLDICDYNKLQQLKNLLKEYKQRTKLYKEMESDKDYILYDLEYLTSKIDNILGTNE